MRAGAGQVRICFAIESRAGNVSPSDAASLCLGRHDHPRCPEDLFTLQPGDAPLYPGGPWLEVISHASAVGREFIRAQAPESDAIHHAQRKQHGDSRGAWGGAQVTAPNCNSATSYTDVADPGQVISSRVIQRQDPSSNTRVYLGGDALLVHKRPLRRWADQRARRAVSAEATSAPCPAAFEAQMEEDWQTVQRADPADPASPRDWQVIGGDRNTHVCSTRRHY